MDAGYSVSTIYEDSISALGAVAQLGERMTGSHEVRGSIPLGSTNNLSLQINSRVSKMGSASLIYEIEILTLTPDQLNFPRI